MARVLEPLDVLEHLGPSIDKLGPPAWQIAIIALLLLGGTVALMQWAQSLSSTRSVIGRPGMLPYHGPIAAGAAGAGGTVAVIQRKQDTLIGVVAAVALIPAVLSSWRTHHVVMGLGGLWREAKGLESLGGGIARVGVPKRLRQSTGNRC